MNNREFLVIMEFLKELKASLDASKSVLPDEELLDSYEMEKLLQCSTSALRRHRINGSVPCSKVGKRYYYPKNLFTQEFLNSITKCDDPSKRFDDQ